MADNALALQNTMDRIATFVGYVEAIDSTDLANVSGPSIQSRVVDWGFVSYVESYADSRTTTIDGHVLTMEGSIEIHLRDGGVIRLDIVVTASDEDGVFGLKDIVAKETAQV